AHIDINDIKAIGISYQMHGLILVDKKVRPGLRISEFGQCAAGRSLSRAKPRGTRRAHRAGPRAVGTETHRASDRKPLS
ncbi:MAG: hypothetical protein R6U51_06620, partial [Anaerolineales bacterium]